MKPTAPPGNTLAEYGIIAALIGVAGMASLAAMGGSLQQGFDGMSQGLAPPQAVALTHGPAQFSQGATGSSPSTPLLSPSSGVLQGKPDINALSSTAQGMPEQIQTLGANGATDRLADRMMMVAQKLLAEGEITPAQSDGIRQLANQGHLIAQAEALLEQKAAQKDWKAFTNDPIQFQGNTYSAWDLSHLIGEIKQPIDPQKDRLSIPLDQPAGMGKTFLELYQQVQSSGAFSNPEAAQVIGDAASQIVSLSQFMNNSVSGIYASSVSVSDIRADIVSQSSNVHAAKACTAGAYSDSGGLCH